MGADGWFVAVPRATWDAEFPDVGPADIGLYGSQVLGVDAVYGYEGDNLIDYESYGQWFGHPKPSDERMERLRAAVEWFRLNAERHMVWT